MILLPVLALGAVGLWQLRQDRAAALAEARAAVEGKLEEAIQVGSSVLTTGPRPETATAIFSANGEVSWPESIPLVPSPNSASNPHAEKLNQIMGDPRLTLSEQAHALHELASMEDCGATAAGFQVRQLALRNALLFGKEVKIEAVTLRDWAFDLTVDAVKHPTILSEKLLLEAREFNTDPPAKETAWNRALESWDRAHASRQFLQEHGSAIQGLLNGLTNQDDEATLSKWIGTGPGIFFKLRKDPEEISLYALTAEGISQNAATGLKPISLPRHLGIRLTLGDRLVFGDPEAEVLSMANDPMSKVRAEIVFTDRDAFFKPIRQRSVRTAWLIAFAVLAAGIGWFAAWRAFVRQRQLVAMKDNFVSAVSHELKAPIAAIGLMAEELGAGSEKRVEYTRLIAGECARLGSLVENVLDYARIESGSDEFNFEEADLGELVRAAAELMRPPAAERGIEIQVQAPPAGEHCAIVDARAIGRAVVNLLDNAIKYAPSEKSITLTAGGDCISVADKGIPIPASERRQIFERFYRSGSELTRETKGVGIGLSLVSHIAKAHSGKAWVESDKTGNRFILQIGEQCSAPIQ